METFKDFQQAASEALRAACEEPDKAEAIRYANVAEKFATQSLAVAVNMRERWLGLSQATCAAGMRIVIENAIG